MFLLARYTVAAAVFLSASAANAVEDATLSADRMLPAAFIADRAPREIDGVFQAGPRRRAACAENQRGASYSSKLAASVLKSA
jgi:hypothetical protein